MLTAQETPVLQINFQLFLGANATALNPPQQKKKNSVYSTFPELHATDFSTEFPRYCITGSHVTSPNMV